MAPAFGRGQGCSYNACPAASASAWEEWSASATWALLPQSGSSVPGSNLGSGSPRTGSSVWREAGKPAHKGASSAFVRPRARRQRRATWLVPFHIGAARAPPGPASASCGRRCDGHHDRVTLGGEAMHPRTRSREARRFVPRQGSVQRPGVGPLRAARQEAAPAFERSGNVTSSGNRPTSTHGWPKLFPCCLSAGVGCAAGNLRLHDAGRGSGRAVATTLFPMATRLRRSTATPHQSADAGLSERRRLKR